MLGLMVVGFEYSAINLAFAALIGLGLAADAGVTPETPAR
jgi:hypothetical protein